MSITSVSGYLATMYGAPTRVGEVGRQASHNSDPFSPDAAPPGHSSHSGGSVSVSSNIGTISHRRLLQAINSPPSPILPHPGSSLRAVLGSSSLIIAEFGFEKASGMLREKPS
jgi:hypothetical protein